MFLFYFSLPDVLMKMPIYPVTNLLNVWHGIITAFGFVGADGLFFVFCLHFSILLKELEVDLSAAIKKPENGTVFNLLKI